MGCASCKPPAMPGVATQMRNAAGAVFRVAGAALQGEAVKAKPETIEARRAICLGSQPSTINSQPVPACDKCVTIAKGGRDYHRCSDCGCWLDGKYFAKWELATEFCKLGKWGAE